MGGDCWPEFLNSNCQIFPGVDMFDTAFGRFRGWLSFLVGGVVAVTYIEKEGISLFVGYVCVYTWLLTIWFTLYFWFVSWVTFSHWPLVFFSKSCWGRRCTYRRIWSIFHRTPVLFWLAPPYSRQIQLFDASLRNANIPPQKNRIRQRACGSSVEDLSKTYALQVVSIHLR